MKTSTRIKISVGIVVFFLIILFISIASYLNKLSNQTSAILKENHISVVYARDMSNSLKNLNQHLIVCFLTSKTPDSSVINKELILFNKSLELEMNNITEPGEGRLAAEVEKFYNNIADSLKIFVKHSGSKEQMLYLQQKSNEVYDKLTLISQLNEQAIQFKTDEAKISAKNAIIQMGILGFVCFLIALIFTYSLSSYFNKRFYQLYNGIKEIVASNYGQRLYFDGKDEFYEISLLFNEMAEKLSNNNQELEVNLHDDYFNKQKESELKELKRVLKLMKGIEEKAHGLILKIEKKD